MKQIIAVAVVVLMSLIAGSGFAGSVAEQGSIEIEAIHSFGGNDTGGWVRGEVNADYRAEGHRSASGEADGSVMLKGDSYEGDHIAKSSALGVINSSAEARGNRLSEVSINGEVKQANWTFIHDGSNSAESWNVTSADYLGGQDRRGITSADGSAVAGGESFSFLKVTPNETKAVSGTFGFSEGNIRTEHCDPTANGFGQAIIGISKFSGSTAAFVSAEGNSNYAAQGPRQAQGELRAFTAGSIKLLPDGVKATATATSSSNASAK